MGMTVAESQLFALEQTANAVAMFTGIRQQFIDNGWSAQYAEAMTLELLHKSAGVQ